MLHSAVTTVEIFCLSLLVSISVAISLLSEACKGKAGDIFDIASRDLVTSITEFYLAIVRDYQVL
jgi:hypothetical protein